MKNSFFIIVFLFVFTLCFSQNDYFSTAENGLLIRNNPSDSAKVIGKFEFGTRITVLEQTNYSHFITEKGEDIKGFWVKVETYNSTYHVVSNQEEGFVFSGFLKNEKDFIAEIKEEMTKFPVLEKYKIDTENDIFCLKGDFFGNAIADLVFLVRNNKDERHIVFIDYQKNSIPKILFLGTTNDPFKIEDYSWTGCFMKINKGETLYSNYEDDFRTLKEVPLKERVVLNYDSIFIHQTESCGGGFIFWKNGKFNWLQQE